MSYSCFPEKTSRAGVDCVSNDFIGNRPPHAMFFLENSNILKSDEENNLISLQMDKEKKGWFSKPKVLDVEFRNSVDRDYFTKIFYDEYKQFKENLVNI